MAGASYAAQTKYISTKISKIRWQPMTDALYEQPNIFITGGYDELSKNSMAVWIIPNVVQDEFNGDKFVDMDPQLLCSADHVGDVTDLLFVNKNLILSSSSNGDVNVLQLDEDSQKLDLRHTYEKLHHHSTGQGCSCTSVCCNDEGQVIATAGEDGTIKVIQHSGSVFSRDVIINIDADNVTINAIRFVDQNTVATINSVGQLKLYDIRGSFDSKFSKKFIISGNLVSLHCMDQHPSQPHMVCVGGNDGQLFVWDLRMDGTPVAIHKGHSASLLDVRFHPDMPNNLFTCSQDGTLWHWKSNESTYSANLLNNFKEQSMENIANTSSWLMDGERSSRAVTINDMLPGNMFPVNSLDVSRNRLLCGLDSEQLFVFSNLVIF